MHGAPVWSPLGLPCSTGVKAAEGTALFSLLVQPTQPRKYLLSLLQTKESLGCCIISFHLTFFWCILHIWSLDSPPFNRVAWLCVNCDLKTAAMQQVKGNGKVIETEGSPQITSCFSQQDKLLPPVLAHLTWGCVLFTDFCPLTGTPS